MDAKILKFLTCLGGWKTTKRKLVQARASTYCKQSAVSLVFALMSRHNATQSVQDYCEFFVVTSFSELSCTHVRGLPVVANREFRIGCGPWPLALCTRTGLWSQSLTATRGLEQVFACVLDACPNRGVDGHLKSNAWGSFSSWVIPRIILWSLIYTYILYIYIYIYL